MLLVEASTGPPMPDSTSKDKNGAGGKVTGLESEWEEVKIPRVPCQDSSSEYEADHHWEDFPEEVPAVTLHAFVDRLKTLPLDSDWF